MDQTPAYALADTHKEFRRAVRQMAEERIAPHAAEVDRDAAFPWDGFKASVEMELPALGIPVAYGGAGRRPRHPGDHGGGARPGVRVDERDHAHLQARDDADLQLGIGVPARTSTSRAWRRARPRPATACPRPTPAATSRRCGAGRARRRPLRAVGHQVLDHQRRGVGHLHRVRQDRPRRGPPGHQLLRGRGRLGCASRQARAQDGAAGQPDRRGRLRRRPRARREPDRRGGPGLHHRHAHPRPQPTHHRRPGRRHRPGCDRLRGAVHDAAQGLRSAHLGVPGAAVHAGRHGHADRGGPDARLPGLLGHRRRETPTTSSR